MLIFEFCLFFGMVEIIEFLVMLLELVWISFWWNILLMRFFILFLKLLFSLLYSMGLSVLLVYNKVMVVK